MIIGDSAIRPSISYVEEGTSIARDGWIDDARPAVDASSERLNVFKPLVTKPHGYGKRAHAMVTEDDDWLVRVEFLMGTGGDFAHGHQDRFGEAGGLELPRFANVQQQGRIRVLPHGGEPLSGDLGLKHGIRIS